MRSCRLFFIIFCVSILYVFAIFEEDVFAAQTDYAPGEVLIAVKRNEAGTTCEKRNGKRKFSTENSTMSTWIADLTYVSSIDGATAAAASVKKQSLTSSVLDVYVADLQEGVSVETAVCELNQQNEVYLAEPNYICQIFDVDASETYPYEEDEYVEQEQWYLQAMEVVPVWKKLEESRMHPGEGVTVAVIDTGVSLLHDDLIGNIVVNQAEAEGEEGVDDDGNGYIDDIHGVNLVNSYTAMTDSTGHGTRMAGLIAMTAGNGGGAGVAYGAGILPVKVSTDGNFTIDKAVEGIAYAAANGADVINMSFGTYRESEILHLAIEDAAKECILVAAAGNDSKANGTAGDNTYPAAYSSVIGVMSVEEDGTFSDFSNWDTQTDETLCYELAAPGRDIWSTALRNSYKTTSGTSAASAMTAGALAVYRGLFPDRESYGAAFLQKSFLASMKHTMIANTADGNRYEYTLANLSDAVSEAENVRNSLSAGLKTAEPTAEPEKTAEPTTTESGKTAEPATGPEKTTEPVKAAESLKPAATELPSQVEETDKTQRIPGAAEVATAPKKTGQTAKKRKKSGAAAIRAKKPVIKLQYLKNGKAKLSFRIKGYSAETGYYVYVSNNKRKGFHKYKITGKKKLLLSSKRKKYYRVAAYKKIKGKRYKSRKSEAVKCFHT